MTRRATAAPAFAAPMGSAAAAYHDKAKRDGSAGASKDGGSPFESWWLDLEKPEVEAARALLIMADRREEAVAFLAAKMKPMKISAGDVRALLLKLGNENENVWKPVFTLSRSSPYDRKVGARWAWRV